MADVIERKYPTSPEVLFSAVEHAVNRLGYRAQAAAPGQHTLSFKTPMSMRMWAQRVEARVVQRADGGSTLFLSRRGQLDDEREQKEVNDRFFAAVESALSEVETPAKPRADRSIAAASPTPTAPATVGTLHEGEHSATPGPPKPWSQELLRQSENAAQITMKLVGAINWQTLTSLRFLIGCALIAVVISALVGQIVPGVDTAIFLLAFAILIIAGAANPNLVLACPHCKKRVKMGATACQYCGQSVRPD